jgi:hypothetical protein
MPFPTCQFWLQSTVWVLVLVALIVTVILLFAMDVATRSARAHASRKLESKEAERRLPDGSEGPAAATDKAQQGKRRRMMVRQHDGGHRELILLYITYPETIYIVPILKGQCNCPYFCVDGKGMCKQGIASSWGSDGW